jgi:hypothetical protein
LSRLVSTAHRRAALLQKKSRVLRYLLPGTELAFEQDVRYNRFWLSTKNAGFRVARFCTIQPRAPEQHRDALAFPDGHIVLVNLLSEGQQARVLQLPVIPREHRASAEKASTPAADLALTV